MSECNIFIHSLTNHAKIWTINANIYLFNFST